MDNPLTFQSRLKSKLARSIFAPEQESLMRLAGQKPRDLLGLDFGREEPADEDTRRVMSFISQQQKTPESMTPEEENSLLGNVMGGVQWLGEALSKPQRALAGSYEFLRGREAGGGLLNLIPFSDTFGWTDPAKGVTPSKVLENEGVMPENTPGFDWMDPLRFGVDVAVDPLWAVAGMPLVGAAAKGANAAKAAAKAATKAGKIGTLDEAVEMGAKAMERAKSGLGPLVKPSPTALKNQILAGERGLVGIKLPSWMNAAMGLEDIPLAQIGAGSRLAAEVVDKTAYNLLARGLRGLFSHKGAGDTFTKNVQVARHAAYDQLAVQNSALHDMAPIFRKHHDALAEKFDGIAAMFPTTEQTPAARDFIRWSNETMRKMGGVSEAANAVSAEQATKGLMDFLHVPAQADLSGLAKAGLDVEATGAKAADLINSLGKVNDGLWKYHESLGGKGGELLDWFVAHGLRRPSLANVLAIGKQRRYNADGSTADSTIARDYRNIPEGARTINRFYTDIEMAGKKVLDADQAAQDAGKLAPGVVVHAKDRANYGWVLGPGKKKGTTKVYFQNPETLKTKIKDLDSKLLTPRIGKDTPADLLSMRPMVDIPEAEHRAALLQRLGGETPANMIPKDLKPHSAEWHEYVLPTDTIEDLQKKVAWKQIFSPASDRAFANPNITANGRLVLREMDGDSVDDLVAAVKEGRLPPDSKTAQAQGEFKEATMGRDEWNAYFLNRGLKETTDATGKKVTKEVPSRLDELMGKMRKMPDRVRHKGLFDREVITDEMDYAKAVTDRLGTLVSYHNFLSAPKVVVKAGEEGGVESLRQTWKKMGLKDDGLVTYVNQNADQLGLKQGDDVGKFIDNLQLSKEGVAGLRTIKDLDKPEVVGALGSLADRLNHAYKTLLFMPWLASHNRNFGSGVFTAATSGNLNIMEMLKGVARAYNTVFPNSPIRKFFKNGDTGQLLHMQTGIDNGLLSAGQLIEVQGKEAAARLAEQVPQGPLGGVLSAFTGTFKQKGAKALIPTQGPFTEAGKKGYQLVEFLLRAGQHDALIAKGFSPGEALAEVMRTQFDYRLMSPFERKVMQRSTVFYGWLRNNLPYRISQLLTRPGGAEAQTIKAMNFAYPEPSEGYVPGFLREGMAFPAGGTPEAQTYLRQSGLPIEDLNKFVVKSGDPIGSAWRTGEKFASSLHPLVTMLPELWAGKQLFTGRSIKDLASPTEKLAGTPVPWLDRFIHYTPASRGVGELMTAVDSRKGILPKLANAISGVKMATYDSERLKQVDLMNALKQQVADSPIVREGTYTYVPERYRQSAQAPAVKEKTRQISRLSQSVKKLSERRKAEQAAKGGQ